MPAHNRACWTFRKLTQCCAFVACSIIGANSASVENINESVDAVDLRLTSSIAAAGEQQSRLLQSLRDDTVASIADTAAALRQNISVVEEEVHASTWSCTMHMDSVEEATKAEMHSTKQSMTEGLAQLKQESEDTMVQKIVPLEQNVAAAKEEVGTALELRWARS